MRRQTQYSIKTDAKKQGMRSTAAATNPIQLDFLSRGPSHAAPSTRLMASKKGESCQCQRIAAESRGNSRLNSIPSAAIHATGTPIKVERALAAATPANAWRVDNRT